MTKRYLVTGCAGFIASRVTEFLLGEGGTVLGLDNLDDAYDPRLKQWRLAQLQALGGFQFHPTDVADRASLDQVLENDARQGRAAANRPAFEAVIHLAARAGVRASLVAPQLYYRTNCEGTLNLLEACRQLEIPKFVLASTSSLYGQHNPVPYREDADTDRPLSPYAATKKAAEALAYSYHYLYGLDVSVLRYFTVYGPAGRPDMSIFRFVRHIAEDEPVVVFGDGNQERDFTYVDDVARGTIAALRPLGYEIINLGGASPVSLRTAIDAIGQRLGHTPRIQWQPPQKADVPRTWADVSKAKELLDWEPRISLDEGLGRAIAWYRDHRELARAIALDER